MAKQPELSKDDMKTILQHLRSVHMTFVLAAVAIISALSNSNTTYETAIQQLQDVVTLNDTLNTKQLVTTIPVTKTYAGNQSEHGLRDFVRNSIAEYFETLDISPEEMTLNSLAVSLPEDIIGLSDPYNDEFQHTGNSLWFETNKALITDGKSEIYVNPTRLFNGQKGTVEQLKSRLDRFLSADTLLLNPNFDVAFFTSGSPLDKRYPPPAEDITNKLSLMTKMDLSITLEGIKLTDAESLGVYKTAQMHVNEDPFGYETYDFRFDELHLSIRASSDTNEPFKFKLILPVMFERQASSFVPNSFKSTQLASLYQSRYLSNIRTFSEMFPELQNVTKNLTLLPPKILGNYLEEQKQKSGAPISVLGLEITRDLVEVWGVILMLAIQLYFCLHYRAFLDRQSCNKSIAFPWIGVYPQFAASFVFQLSLALPLAATLFANMWLRQPDDNHVLEGFVILFSVGLFVSAELMYLTFRSNTMRLEKQDGDQIG